MALSHNEIAEYRALFRQVNLSLICQENGLNRRVIYAVLAGESSRYDEVEAAAVATREELLKRKTNVRRIQGRRRTAKA